MHVISPYYFFLGVDHAPYGILATSCFWDWLHYSDGGDLRMALKKMKSDRILSRTTIFGYLHKSVGKIRHGSKKGYDLNGYARIERMCHSNSDDRSGIFSLISYFFFNIIIMTASCFTFAVARYYPLPKTHSSLAPTNS